MFTNIICSVIGIITALALAIQFHWGAWGLLASLAVFPPAGWVLADWRGFVSSVKRAGKVVWKTAPEIAKQIRESVSKNWRDAKKLHQETKCGYLMLLSVFYFLPLWGLTEHLIWWAALSGPHSTLAELILGLLLTFLFSALISFLTILTASLAVSERDEFIKKIYRHKFPDNERPYDTSLMREKHPEIWAEAEAQTRAWSEKMLKYGNPVILTFVILYWMSRAFWWLLMNAPGALLRAIVWGFWAIVGVIRLTYIYANSDLRRIAFSSIALGMIIGFAVGYHLGQPLAGVIVGGMMTGVAGWIQNRLIYQRLIAAKIIKS